MEIERLNMRLRDLSRRKRVAFVAFCVQHVIPIFKIVFDEPDQNQPDAAVEFAWRFVEGESVSKEHAVRLQEELGEVLQVMNRSKHVLDAAKDVCMAAIYLLDAIIALSEAKSVSHAERAVGFSQAAVEHYEDYEGPGVVDELRTQKRALETIASLTTESVSREIFQELNAVHPAWKA